MTSTATFETIHPRDAGDGQFVDKTQSAPDTSLASDDRFVAVKGTRNGQHAIEAEQTHPQPVNGRYIIHIGGAPEVNARMAAIFRLYTPEERAWASLTASDLANEGAKMTVLADRGNGASAIEGTGGVYGGRNVIFCKGSKSKYYELDKLNLINVEKGYGRQDSLAATFDEKASLVPVTEKPTYDGLPEYGESDEDDETDVTTIAAVYLIDGPDFGNGKEPGCMFLATDIQSADGIVNGYFWTPDDAVLLTSESGSFYTKDLDRRAGRLRDFKPNSLTYTEAWHLDEDRATGYRQVLGK